MPTSRFTSALSTEPDTLRTVEAVACEVRQQLQAPIDLAFVFLWSGHRGAADEATRRLMSLLDCKHLVGCTGESIVSGGVEVEDSPAIALWAARLPETRIEPLRLAYQRTPDGGGFLGWPETLHGPWSDDAVILLLADPFSFPADVLLERMNEDRPGVPICGGMASGGAVPGENRLLLNENVWLNGAVGVWLQGGPRIETLVSQGCRPIGRPYVITRAEGNQIFELGGKPALRELQQLFQEQANRDQRLMQQGLHLGRVVNEQQESFEAGDFLIRNVVGTHVPDQAIVVADFFRRGQTVQFHLRDAETADLELQHILRQASSSPDACLLFTCNGRGQRLFAEPHHDAQAIQQAWGPTPLAGFFAQGELGPVGGRNFLHGFTASIVAFD